MEIAKRYVTEKIKRYKIFDAYIKKLTVKTFKLTKLINLTKLAIESKSIMLCLFYLILLFFLILAVINFSGCQLKESTLTSGNSNEKIINTNINANNTNNKGANNKGAEAQNGQDEITSTQQTVESNLLIVGSDTTYPPFSYIEKSEIVGFDIDIIKEIAARLEKDIKIISTEWDPEFKEIKEDKIDAFISAVIYDETKENIIDFSKPYYKVKFLLLTLIGSQANTNTNTSQKVDKAAINLKGKNIGCLDSSKGFIKEDYLLNYKISYYSDINKMLNALKAKEIDGIILSLPLAINLLKENSGIYQVIEEITSEKQYAIVLQNNSLLKEKINGAIDKIFEDGTYEEIYSRWFTY